MTCEFRSFQHRPGAQVVLTWPLGKDFLVSPLNWTVIECSLGIICISIPPMRPLLAKIFPAFISDYLSRYATFDGGHNYNSNVVSGHSKTRSGPLGTVMSPQAVHLDMDRQLEQFERMSGGGGGVDPGLEGCHQRKDWEKTIEMVRVDNASSTAKLTERTKENSDQESDCPRAL